MWVRLASGQGPSSSHFFYLDGPSSCRRQQCCPFCFSPLASLTAPLPPSQLPSPQIRTPELSACQRGGAARTRMPGPSLMSTTSALHHTGQPLLLHHAMAFAIPFRGRCSSERAVLLLLHAIEEHRPCSASGPILLLLRFRPRMKATRRGAQLVGGWGRGGGTRRCPHSTPASGRCAGPADCSCPRRGSGGAPPRRGSGGTPGWGARGGAALLVAASRGASSCRGRRKGVKKRNLAHLQARPT